MSPNGHSRGGGRGHTANEKPKRSKNEMLRKSTQPDSLGADTFSSSSGQEGFTAGNDCWQEEDCNRDIPTNFWSGILDVEEGDTQPATSKKLPINEPEAHAPLPEPPVEPRSMRSSRAKAIEDRREAMRTKLQERRRGSQTSSHPSSSDGGDIKPGADGTGQPGQHGGDSSAAHGHPSARQEGLRKLASCALPAKVGSVWLVSHHVNLHSQPKMHARTAS
eukprot:scaffold5643_cov26-Prasinocladus_malaysianus.AAC.1